MGRKQTQEVGEHVEFAARLRLAVEKSGISGNQNKIGSMFDVTGAFYGQMLRGFKCPGTETGVKMAIKLNVSFEWLMTGRGEMEYCDTSDPVEREASRLIAGLPLEYREELLALIRASAKLQERTLEE